MFKASPKALLNIIENSADLVAMATPDGRLLQINESGQYLLAIFDETELNTLTLPDLLSETEWQTLRDTAIPEALETGVWQGQVTFLGQDGMEILMSLRIIANLTEKEQTRILGLLGNDITEQKWLGVSLKESETRFRSSFENTSLGMALISTEGYFLQVNKAMTELLGYDEQEFMNRSIFDLIHSEDVSRVNFPIQRLQKGEVNTIKGEVKYQRKDGTTLWGYVNATAIQDAQENTSYFLVQIQDITEQKLSKDALIISEERTRLVIDTALDGVITINELGEIIGWNQQAAQIFGWSGEEIIGKTLAETIIPHPYRKAHQKGLIRYLETGIPRVLNKRIELSARHHDGYEFPVEISISVLETGNSTSFSAFVRDITEKKKLENQLQATLKTQERQLEIGQALATAQTEQEVLDVIVEKARYYPNAALSVTYWETGADGEKYDIVKRQSAFESGIKMLAEGTRTAWNQSPFSPQYSAEGLFICNDLAADTRLDADVRQSFTSTGINGLAIFPLVASGEWLGNMVVMTKAEAFFNEQVLSFYRALAEQSSVALRATRLFKNTQMSLERRTREVELTIQIAQEISTSLNLTDLYQRVVEQIKEQFDYYHVQLLRYDPYLDTVALVYGYGETGRKMLEMNHSLPLGAGLIGVAAETGRTTYRGDVTADPNWRPNPLLPDTRSEIAVPIKLGDDVLGVLDVQSDHINDFDEDAQLLLEGLCGQIAVAFESTQLREEMDARVDELTTLQRYMSREGWESYRMAREYTLAGYQFDQQGVAAFVPPSEQGGAPENGGGGDTAVTIPTLETPGTVVGVEAIGALGIQSDEENPLTYEEMEFIRSVSSQVAEALEAARLFEQTQDALSEQERLSTQLETVAQVSTAASTVLEVDTLLQAVVDLTKASFNLYHTHIYLMDPQTHTLVLRAGADQVGRLMTLEGRRINLDDESIIARAVKTREGVVENDVRKIVDFIPNPLLPHTRAELAVPLIVGDQVIGVLDLQADRVDFFTEEDISIHRTLASQIAVAVQNATLFAEQVAASAKLREVDRLKSEFLASMSHELRTPLNSIIGFADVLLEGLDGELNERMEEDVRLIRDSGRHLRELIGDILDMSKIEAGRMELRYEEIDMVQMSHDIIATAAPLAETKNIALYSKIADDVGTIEADRTRLRQVLWNIMGNAIKFTQKGSVTLSMEYQGNDLLVGIQDTGIGISEENKAVVFEQFRQVDGNLNRSVGGTGLGMPITKKLVELHGGDIWIESVEGQGTTFWFTLPKYQYYRKPKGDTSPLKAD
jgi:PAS domain S-box-containing protein